jgi:hypothetical protein
MDLHQIRYRASLTSPQFDANPILAKPLRLCDNVPENPRVLRLLVAVIEALPSEFTDSARYSNQNGLMPPCGLK